MGNATTALGTELTRLGTELKKLGAATIAAIHAQDEDELERTVAQREHVLARVREIGTVNRREVLACVELADAARQEAEVLTLALARRDELSLEYESLHQRVALREAYE